jgi:Ca2+-binding RTX toxin-like protein
MEGMHMISWLNAATFQVVPNAAPGEGIVVGPVVETGSAPSFLAGSSSTNAAASINVLDMAYSNYATLQNSVASPWMMVGGSGNDAFYGGYGNDAIVGNDGNDTLGAMFGTNWIDGGSGNDTLFAGLTPSAYIGGSGTDTLVVASAPGNLLLSKTTIDLYNPTTSTVASYTGNMVLDTFNNVNYGFVDKSVETITFLPSGSTLTL